MLTGATSPTSSLTDRERAGLEALWCGNGPLSQTRVNRLARNWLRLTRETASSPSCEPKSPD